MCRECQSNHCWTVIQENFGLAEAWIDLNRAINTVNRLSRSIQLGSQLAHKQLPAWPTNGGVEDALDLMEEGLGYLFGK